MKIKENNSLSKNWENNFKEKAKDKKYISFSDIFFEIDLDVHNTSEQQMKNSLLLNKNNVNKIYNYFQKLTK